MRSKSQNQRRQATQRHNSFVDLLKRAKVKILHIFHFFFDCCCCSCLVFRAQSGRCLSMKVIFLYYTLLCLRKARDERETFCFFFLFFPLISSFHQFYIFWLGAEKVASYTIITRFSHSLRYADGKWNGNEEKQSVGSRKENLYLHLATCTSDLLKQIFLQSPKC